MTRNAHMPAGLLGCTMALWAWKMDLTLLGMMMAALVEIPVWLPWRLQFNKLEFIRISDLTSVILACVSVFFLVQQLQEGLFATISWMPAIGFPLLCAQVYSELQAVPMAALIYRLRGNKAYYGTGWPETIDLRPGYFALTLIAIFVAARHEQWLYPVACALVFWLLWKKRTRMNRKIVWGLLATAAALSGYVTQVGLNNVTVSIQNRIAQWMMEDWSKRNLLHASTSLGQIGRLKQSDRIIMRIDTDHLGAMYLRQAGYNQLIDTYWHGGGSEGSVLEKLPGTDVWLLGKSTVDQQKQLTISTELSDGVGVLALPAGTRALEIHENVVLSHNRNGAVTVEGYSGSADYTAYYQEHTAEADLPEAIDLWLSKEQRAFVAPMLRELLLDGYDARGIATTLRGHFQNAFTYSLVQGQMFEKHPLPYFLYQSHSGHCEYFATAGVLLLRAKGIPARYMTGYLMTEYDAERRQYLVRERHAHAWVSAYVDGQWEDWDFTPAQWLALEEDASAWWVGAYNLGSHAWYDVKHWITGHRDDFNLYVTILGGILLLGYLIKDFAKTDWHAAWKRLTPQAGDMRDLWPGKDSALYDITAYLESHIAPRSSGETLARWITRLESTGRLQTTSLKLLLEQHYRMRFGVKSPGIEVELRAGVEAWFADQGIARPAARPRR